LRDVCADDAQAAVFVQYASVIYIICQMNIGTIDLNLLVVFGALMEERNVTRAAHRLGLSQPATSAALKRLRETLADPLFVRSRGGMRPTPRAEDIFAAVGQSLNAIQSALRTGAAFVPREAERTFNLMMSDIGEIVYLPRLVRVLRRDAPGVQLFVRRLARPRVHDELASGSIDLAIGWMEHANGLCHEALFHEEFVCIVRPDHPRVKRRLTASQFASEWHLVVGRRDFGADTLFRSAGSALRHGLPGVEATPAVKVAMTVPHFLAVPNIIANTDLVCVVPRRLAQVYADFGQVRIAALPAGGGSFEVSQFWHKRLDTDPASIWLRQVVRGLFAHPSGDRSKNHDREDTPGHGVAAATTRRGATSSRA
jgi:DNA-binding transcriptional LysR family regulator